MSESDSRELAERAFFTEYTCIVCGKGTNKVYYSMAIIFGAEDDIDVGPWCDDCKPSGRTLASRIRYLLKKMN